MDMNKQASLTDLFAASMGMQDAIPSMEKYASQHIPQYAGNTYAPEMQKSAAEVYLDEMCKQAAIDYHIEREQDKLAGDYYGKLWSQSMWAGFTKAAELDGVTITNDAGAVNNVPTTDVQKTPAVEPAGAGQAGWDYLNQNLPSKPVGQVGSASTFEQPVGLFSVPSAT